MNTKIATLAVSMLMTMSTIAQKNEVKAAEKALKKKDYATALTEITKADELISNADEKLKAKYYYIKGMALYAEGSDNSNLDETITTFNKLKEVEKASNVSKYSNEVTLIIDTIIEKITSGARAAYTDGLKTNDIAKLSEAANGFEKVYSLKKSDTLNLYNSAVLNQSAKNYEKSNNQFKKLIELGYTGISTTYTATSTVNDQLIGYNSSSEMMQAVKMELARDPKTTVIESKYNDMVRNIGTNYSKLGENEKALEFVLKAKESFPNDYNLLITEGTIYFNMGDRAKYLATLQEAIELKPNDPQLHYFVGTLIFETGENLDKAQTHLEKAIELKPDYVDAYMNLGAIAMNDVAAIEEEMSQNASNFKKYDEIVKNKRNPTILKAIPFYEKAYELSSDEEQKEGLRKQLNSYFEALNMEKRI
ncbi:MAG: hypothetical protein BM563_05605 [Bacteroidetes bacterium MedPE-SWsnd-G1]|nr:MAG: hypothetical protein BM563_05605 [Bacteroidetes bacterium MedPE-SWsnd-G1]